MVTVGWSDRLDCTVCCWAMSPAMERGRVGGMGSGRGRGRESGEEEGGGERSPELCLRLADAWILALDQAFGGPELCFTEGGGGRGRGGE